jgi:rSAM/selenodomain-associated transferase 1
VDRSEINTAKPTVCAMAVMAKAPQPGRSKTRLAPPLLPEQAAGLSAAFLRDITENIAAAGRQAGIYGCIAYAPLGLESLFDGHLADGTGLVLADGSPPMPDLVQGFGRCLLHAVQSLLAQGFDSACVINSDSPTLPTDILVRTAALLAQPGDRVVLGPAEDGGYYLLGVKQAHAHLFEDIVWSTANVAEQTVLRAREIGLELVMLPKWYDVDDAGSLRQLMRSLEQDAIADDASLQPFAAPATVAYLRHLRLPQFVSTELPV